jgi:uncharacterized membrane protein YsdA (DUF1294 family)
MGCITYPMYGLAAVVAVAYATVQVHDRLDVAWWLAYLVAINAAAFAFYAFDKIFVGLLQFLRLRVPEDVLLWELALPGGILGAALAMVTFGHKTGPETVDFRVELLKAYTAQITLLFVAVRWALVPLEQVDVVIKNLASIVLSAVQVLLATVKTS